ncbi:hypothetical protein GCM10022384_50310 [Streptomyces marokkonensis]|uniref:Uncharacterized protein n=1 Tax=Streptomyces marokkonensis TaxID=324855 RepID=A0ABP7RGG1_9ACTN
MPADPTWLTAGVNAVVELTHRTAPKRARAARFEVRAVGELYTTPAPATVTHTWLTAPREAPALRPRPPPQPRSTPHA